jgi:cytochrome c oxidase subunit II
MAINPPETRVWWNEPIARGELVWIAIAFVWGLIMFFMMIYWHAYGAQNLSTNVGWVDPTAYEKMVTAFAEKYKVRAEGSTGVPVVKPPPGGDAYMFARTFEGWPILELEKGQTYRLHLSSLDLMHGFSLQPVNMNIEIHPGIEQIITVTPKEAGTFGVVCNEYCGLGHQTMVGRMYVVEPGKGG